MSLPPLDKRSITILTVEQGRLQETYDKCAAVLGPSISPSGARALDRINDALAAIAHELETRGTK